MSYQVKLEVFEGPLDLLLHLIDKEEVDIYDIPIARITGQYLEYLHAMEELDLEITSEFLVMAATLLSIKARMLLPKPQNTEIEQEEEDPRDELVARLVEYKKYKQIAERLRHLEEEFGSVFTRPVNREFLQAFQQVNPVEGVEISLLAEKFIQLLDRVPKDETFDQLPHEEITIADKMRELKEVLQRQPKGVCFNDLFSGRPRTVEVVVTFLALLELIRLQQVIIHQPKPFGPILIWPRQDGAAGVNHGNAV